MAILNDNIFNKWERALGEEAHDMQALIKRGFKKLTEASYLILTITDPKQAKQYFRCLIENNEIKTAKWKEEKSETNPLEAVQIAFTSSGLLELGLDKTVWETFSREFKEGMAYPFENDGERTRERSIILGDVGASDPRHWHWGNKKTDHCVLMLFADSKGNLEKLIKRVYTDIRKGVDEEFIDTCENKQLKEHFGFDDGISQPLIQGFTKSKSQISEQTIKPGEFVLGYENEYENYSPSPYIDSDDSSIDLPPCPEKADKPCKAKKDLGKNGTYMVFRQIEQLVERFWKYQYENSNEAGFTQIEKAIKLASKMVGRLPDGRPLVKSPNGDPIAETDNKNDFFYSKIDENGTRCPFGAHIRRTNPRDQVHTVSNGKPSLDISNTHRLLRRGRIYGPFLKDTIEEMIEVAKDYVEQEVEGQAQRVRGLNFICLVSDIQRQFEFVQSVWANTSTFAKLSNEVDPIISPRPTKDQPDCHEFTAPQEIIRNRYKEVPEFTTVVGGAYFFMPGIKALKYILR